MTSDDNKDQYKGIVDDEDQIGFQVDGQILNELSKQVSSHLFALGELMKNSYDAKATKIEIIFDKKKRLLVIEDDGEGISKDDFKSLLHIAKSGKEYGREFKFNKNNKTITRYTQGSKGLGLFCAFKFGDLVVWDTNYKNDSFKLTVNKSDVIGKPDISQIKFPIEKGSKTDFGTKISITIDLNDNEIDYIYDFFKEEKNSKKIARYFHANDIEVSISLINKEGNKEVVFSNIIRKYSNTRSSTYKLHIKESCDILNLKNKVVNDFKKQVLRDFPKFSLKVPDVTLLKGNVLEVAKKIPDNSVDLTITSPPYGDNKTTVTYGQFSSLALFWIDDKDLNLEGWELANYSSIDRMSLGGRRNDNISKLDKELLDPYLKKISHRKQTKVTSFFADYFASLNDICRVTDKYIVMTLGNRTVDGININLTEITSRYIERQGFTRVDLLSRDIPQKRIPKVTSSVNNKSVSSMNEEFVIIYNKESL